LGGPYCAPASVIGDTLRCEMRGHVRVASVSAGKIPWPQARNGWNGTGRHYLILCGDLARAVQCESSQAVAHWWGVSITIVWTWRRALKVPQNNAGTRKLRQRLAPEVLDDEARARLVEKCKSPEFGAAVSARQKGKGPPAEVRAKAHAARRGK